MTYNAASLPLIPPNDSPARLEDGRSGAVSRSRFNVASMMYRVPSVATVASAVALVAASAGFGAYYAWTTGNHHGPVIGALSVCMALGLEAAKPFAIEGAFAALRQFSPFRALAMAALATVAVAYSLTAELSLMASSRADASATRSQSAVVAEAAKGRYTAAKQELQALPITRPVAAIEAEIARLKAAPRLALCDDVTAKAFGPVSRRVCGEIAKLSAEVATTARRIELQAALATAEADVAAAPPSTDADPAAAALVTYLAAAGVHADADELSRWLALVPVLALEIGSAFAVILAGGTASARNSSKAGRKGVPKACEQSAVEPVEAGSAAAGTVSADVPNEAQGGATEALSDALLEHLKEHGGSLRTGQRRLAQALGTSTSELHRTLHALAATGAIALSTAPTGTELRLLS